MLSIVTYILWFIRRLAGPWHRLTLRVEHQGRTALPSPRLLRTPTFSANQSPSPRGCPTHASSNWGRLS